MAEFERYSKKQMQAKKIELEDILERIKKEKEKSTVISLKSVPLSQAEMLRRRAERFGTAVPSK
jgi:hypothetical protein